RLQRARTPERAGPGAAPPSVHEVLRSPGAPLDSSTRAFMEARFGHDFGRVRVHTGPRAEASAGRLQARAYTLGSDVVFGAGAWAPRRDEGRRLLAHELAHVVQQSARPPTAGPLRLGRPGDATERAADEAAREVTSAGAESRVSAGPRLRGCLLASAPAAPTVQRAVKTWAGEFVTDNYEGYKPSKDEDNVKMEIDLRFKPGKAVNATRIGLVQATSGKNTGKPDFSGGVARRRSIPAGETGAGTFIDTRPGARSPLYAAGRVRRGDTLASTRTRGGFGEHGWRYFDASGELQKQDALLYDRPEMPAPGPNSEQVFETTAVALEGAQEGAFYGSVCWGWKMDARRKLTKIELGPVSTDVPSPVFAAAAKRWNEGKNRWGRETLDLAVAAGANTKVSDAQVVGSPEQAKETALQTLDLGTRVEVTATRAGADGKEAWSKVTVVDGPQAGLVGWLLSSALTTGKTSQ
ncbi:MAG TPA: DUF4157 domain-containing protein, partial [Longimicrobium sp.]|nr:DUF4157 domain-containing protein [Longimicrobium sp.]